MYLATVVLPGHAGFGCTHLAVVNHAMMRCWRDKPLADVSVLTLGKLHHLQIPSQMLQQQIAEHSMWNNFQSCDSQWTSP